MLIDLDNLSWIDMNKNDDGLVSTLMMGFSIIVDIFKTEFTIENNLCNSSDSLDKSIRYTAVFNGQGNTFKEMETAFDSNFEEIPFPEMFPIIGQSDSINKLKKLCMYYIELQYGATRDSKKLRRDLENQDEILKHLINKYMDMFTIKSYLN